jgi:hypothetical protein
MGREQIFMGNIKVINDKKIRTQLDAEKEDWHFSIVDVIAVLSGSSQSRKF